MNTLSTHVLDATAGTPASEVEVTLTDSAGTVLGTGVTDDDGRITSMTESPSPRERTPSPSRPATGSPSAPSRTSIRK